ncbi:MAG: type II toxin-antitoxin system RelE/ParE family toxin [Nanoarchaeota archaeon]
MHNFQVSEHLQEVIKKLAKKDKSLYEQLLKKIEEVVESYDLKHYKNLRYNMKDSKRVHLGHFVLVFQYEKKSDTINFDDFDHHDNIYKKK